MNFFYKKTSTIIGGKIFARESQKSREDRWGVDQGAPENIECGSKSPNKYNIFDSVSFSPVLCLIMLYEILVDDFLLQIHLCDTCWSKPWRDWKYVKNALSMRKMRRSKYNHYFWSQLTIHPKQNKIRECKLQMFGNLWAKNLVQSAMKHRGWNAVVVYANFVIFVFYIKNGGQWAFLRAMFALHWTIWHQ